MKVERLYQLFSLLEPKTEEEHDIFREIYSIVGDGKEND